MCITLAQMGVRTPDVQKDGQGRLDEPVARRHARRTIRLFSPMYIRTHAPDVA